MNILIAPDKFKGSLTALEVCNAVEEGILKYNSKIEITKLPLADGGEGSLFALEETIKFNKIYLDVKNPLFNKINTFYGLIDNVAYIEMAAASGLQLLKEDERSAMFTTTLGTGEIILDALGKGANKIYLFVGGSATNDGGIGLASALGYEFKDSQGIKLEPIGANLINIKTIDVSKAVNFNNIEVNILTDVNNPLFGLNGAAHVFAKQKGASEKEIVQLDEGLKNFSSLIKTTFGIDVSNINGSGAAGGLGAGAIAFCNGKIKSGIETILELLNFDKALNKSNFVITGEGLLDKQTLDGKVVKGVMDRCQVVNKPFGILCGDFALTQPELKEINATIIKSIKQNGMSKEQSMNNAYPYLVKRAEEMVEKIF